MFIPNIFTRPLEVPCILLYLFSIYCEFQKNMKMIIIQM